MLLGSPKKNWFLSLLAGTPTIGTMGYGFRQLKLTRSLSSCAELNLLPFARGLDEPGPDVPSSGSMGS